MGRIFRVRGYQGFLLKIDGHSLVGGKPGSQAEVYESCGFSPFFTEIREFYFFPPNGLFEVD